MENRCVWNGCHSQVPNVQPRDNRDGALLIRTLSVNVTQNTVDKLAVSRERFSKPASYRLQLQKKKVKE